MRKTKQTLAFEQLEAEVEIIKKVTQLQFKGGVSETLTLNAIDSKKFVVT